MPRPESTPAQMSVESVLEKRRHRRPFDIEPTDIEGVSLRVEAGTRPDILKKTIGRFALIATAYADRKNQIKELSEQQTEPDKEIKDIAEAHEGLRGIQSDTENYGLSVFPKPSISWDIEKLKESLGLAYSSVVHEDLVTSISIPHGYHTRKGPLNSDLLSEALVKGLAKLGLPEGELGMIIHPEVVPRVDEAKLADMLRAGQVRLLEGTAEITSTWAITVDPLHEPKTA